MNGGNVWNSRRGYEGIVLHYYYYFLNWNEPIDETILTVSWTLRDQILSKTCPIQTKQNEKIVLISNRIYLFYLFIYLLRLPVRLYISYFFYPCVFESRAPLEKESVSPLALSIAFYRGHSKHKTRRTSAWTRPSLSS